MHASERTGDPLAQLDARLRLLEDERSILETLCRYGHTIDYGLHPEWVDCFTEEGAFDIRFRGERQARIEGRPALASFISHHTVPPERFHKHLMVEPVITLDGDEATVESYYVRLDGHGENGMTPAIKAFGRYSDHLLRCDDGRWRFTERIGNSDAFDDLGQLRTWLKS